MSAKILCFAGGRLFDLIMTCCFAAAGKDDERPAIKSQ